FYSPHFMAVRRTIAASGRRDFFLSSRRRHTRFSRDWSSDVCSSDLDGGAKPRIGIVTAGKSYLDTRQALDMLGVDAARAAALGQIGRASCRERVEDAPVGGVGRTGCSARVTTRGVTAQSDSRRPAYS